MISLILVGMVALGCFSMAYGGTVEQVMEGSMNLEITYPDSVTANKTFPVTVLIQNDGWEAKHNITLAFYPTSSLASADREVIHISMIPQGGSHGSTLEFTTVPNALPGTHYINIDYSQTLADNLQETSIAVPILVRERSMVDTHAVLPESIFMGAEFPLTVTVSSDDTSIYDVTLTIVPPEDVHISGETRHVFSSIQKGEIIRIDSRIATPDQEIDAEYRIPFQILLKYSDGEDQLEDSVTISTTLRPRTFMELTTDGGIWVGDFFIAPYVSLGTIIGIPAGAILTLILRRRR